MRLATALMRSASMTIPAFDEERELYAVCRAALAVASAGRVAGEAM